MRTYIIISLILICTALAEVHEGGDYNDGPIHDGSVEVRTPLHDGSAQVPSLDKVWGRNEYYERKFYKKTPVRF